MNPQKRTKNVSTSKSSKADNTATVAGVKDQVRKASSGDTAPTKTTAGIQRHVISESVRAAREAKINAVKDIISGVPPHDVETLTKVLTAIMDGTSSDDAAVLRNALLLEPYRPPGDEGVKADDALSSKWREGGI